MPIDFDTIFNRFLDLANTTGKRREDYLANELIPFCDRFSEQQQILLRHICEVEDVLVEAGNALEDDYTSFNSANFPISRKVKEAIDEIKKRRHETKHERLAIKKIADDRIDEEIFTHSVFQVLDDEQRREIRQLYEFVSGTFEYRTSREYSHELSEALRSAVRLVDSWTKNEQNPSPEFDIKRRITRALWRVHQARDKVQDQLGEVERMKAKLKSRIRNP